MSPTRIEKLTPAQEALIPQYREKWRAILLSTQAIDRIQNQLQDELWLKLQSQSFNHQFSVFIFALPDIVVTGQDEGYSLGKLGNCARKVFSGNLKCPGTKLPNLRASKRR